MKKILTFLILLMGFVGSSWATDVTATLSLPNSSFIAAKNATGSAVTVNSIISFVAKGSSSGTVAAESGDQKFQDGTSFTVSGATITKVEITTASGKTQHDFTANPVGSSSTSNLVQTWTGSATSITFTNSSGRNIYLSSIVVTYTSSGSSKTTPTLNFASSSVSTTVGANIASPTLTTTNPSSGLSISYASGTQSVATVDASTGVVTGVGVGSAIITATSASTDAYNSATATYTVDVATGTLTLSTPSDQSVTVGNTVAAPAITATSANGNTVSGVTYTYASDKTTVATVDANTGVVTGVDAGTATITATASATGYSNATKTYTVTVTAATPSATYPHEWNFEDANSWSGTTLTAGTWWTSTSAGYKYLKATSTSQLTYNDGSTVVPVSTGLYFTADAGKIYLNPDTYLRIGKNGQTTLTIPNVPAGYNIIFKVGSPSSSDARGIAVTSSNATLTSGTASTSKTNFIFHVNTTGDVTFQNTSTGGDLLIYDIQVVSSTLSDPELKIMSGSTDISNTSVDIVQADAATTIDGYTFSKANGYGGTLGVTIDNTNLVTYNSTTGKLAYVTNATGTATITVTAPASGNYLSATATLTIFVGAQMTLAFSKSGTTTNAISVNYGHLSTADQLTATYPTLQYTINGTAYPSTAWGVNNVPTTADGLTFTSSNTKVALVDATTGLVSLVGVGETTISVTKAACQIDGTYYMPASTWLTLTVLPSETTFTFTATPATAKLNYGKSMYILIKHPSAVDATTLTSQIGTITATSSSDIITVGAVTTNYAGNSYFEITSKGASVNEIGQTITITATMSGGTSFGKTSTTSEITITPADQRNFSFVNHSGKMYVGDFIAIPGITGNATENTSTTYYNKFNSTSTSNTTTYRPYTDMPVYSLSSTNAELYYIHGQSATTDTLFIYGKTAGTVTITATDKNISTLTDTYTLTILPNLDDAHTTALSNITYPYTWDFTKNFSVDALATDKNYWTDNTSYYSNALGYYNMDGMTTSGTRLPKKFSADGSLITPFKGLQIKMNNTYIEGKVGRFRVGKYDATNPNAPRLNIQGGQDLMLPDATSREQEVSGYRIYVKAVGNSAKASDNNMYLTYTNTSGSKTTAATYQVSNTAGWYAFDVTKGATNIDLNVDDCWLYCISVSTEAKNISAADYASYSYATDMDLALTKESQNVTAYAVSATGNNKATMVEVSKAAASQGLIIKNSSSTAGTGTATDFYFLPNAKNVDGTYTALSGYTKTDGTTATNNMLVAVSEDNTTIAESSTDGLYWNYVLTNSHYNKGNSGTTYSGIGFFISDGTVKLNNHSAYLPVSKTAQAKGYFLMSFDDEEVTGIEDATISNDNRLGDGYYYNLNGMRVTNPSKGIFIHNGKKIVIK